MVTLAEQRMYFLVSGCSISLPSFRDLEYKEVQHTQEKRGPLHVRFYLQWNSLIITVEMLLIVLYY